MAVVDPDISGNAEFGDVPIARTGDSELFVNPLMSVYFTVDLPGLASHVHCLSELSAADTVIEVALAIERHHAAVSDPRPGVRSRTRRGTSRP